MSENQSVAEESPIYEYLTKVEEGRIKFSVEDYQRACEFLENQGVGAAIGPDGFLDDTKLV